MGDLEAEPAVRERQDVRCGRAAPPRVGDDDDLEFEALRGVDRQEPDRVGSLLFGDRVGFLRADGLLAPDKADESLEVAAAQLLVRPGEAGELAEIGIASAAVVAGENGEVVVVLRQHTLAQELERRVRGELEQPLVALTERQQQPAVALGEIPWQRTLEAAEDRLALRLGPDQHERVVRDADERRCEHGEQRLVVVPVVE